MQISGVSSRPIYSPPVDSAKLTPVPGGQPVMTEASVAAQLQSTILHQAISAGAVETPAQQAPQQNTPPPANGRLVDEVA